MIINGKFVFVGKTKESFYIEGIDKYKKILKKYGKFEIVELKSPKNIKDSNLLKDKESESIEKALRKDAYKIFLDIKGKEFHTEELSKKFSNLIDTGINKFDFVVGGAFGINDTCLKNSNFTWKLSKLTFNHQMVRIILMEQVYRILSIINGETYHH